MIVQPAMYELGLMDWADDAIDWIQFGLFGVASIVVVYVVCRPLEAWRPVEPVTDRRAIRTDIFYTLLTRLGVLPLVAFAGLPVATIEQVKQSVHAPAPATQRSAPAGYSAADEAAAYALASQISRMSHETSMKILYNMDSGWCYRGESDCE